MPKRGSTLPKPRRASLPPLLSGCHHNHAAVITWFLGTRCVLCTRFFMCSLFAVVIMQADPILPHIAPREKKEKHSHFVPSSSRHHRHEAESSTGKETRRVKGECSSTLPMAGTEGTILCRRGYICRSAMYAQTLDLLPALLAPFQMKSGPDAPPDTTVTSHSIYHCLSFLSLSLLA